MSKNDRVRINLSVDSKILELVKKWSYISGLPISTLFDRVFERETRPFTYESEEAWEDSQEFVELGGGNLNNLAIRPILDTSASSMPEFNFTDEEYASVGIIKNDGGEIDFFLNARKLEKLYLRKIRGKGYYERWKEVCVKDK